ncbi:MAG TPA: hypothetical protein VIJ75_12215 [Hanamia sp.]
MRYFLFLLILFTGATKSFAQSGDKPLNREARTLINLLDYVSQDYLNAVENGQINRVC